MYQTTLCLPHDTSSGLVAMCWSCSVRLLCALQLDNEHSSSTTTLYSFHQTQSPSLGRRVWLERLVDNMRESGVVFQSNAVLIHGNTLNNVVLFTCVVEGLIVRPIWVC